jgi:aspartyl protease family protein
VLALTVLVVYLVGRFPGEVDTSIGKAHLTERLLWVALIGASLAVHMRTQPGLALRYTAIWVAIGASLVLAYSFRFEAEDIGNRLMAELLPSRAVVEGDAVTFRTGTNGQFVVDGEVNGTRMRFLVDTGASHVALTLADAKRIGIDADSLVFNQAIRTANGIVYSASVFLDAVTVGTITMRNVDASISQGELTQSLLGMSFLGQLSSYEITRDTLTFRP